jgi:hypothetical protein
MSGIKKIGKEDYHGELQPRDSVHRLRYVRQVKGIKSNATSTDSQLSWAIKGTVQRDGSGRK